MTSENSTALSNSEKAWTSIPHVLHEELELAPHNELWTQAREQMIAIKRREAKREEVEHAKKEQMEQGLINLRREVEESRAARQEADASRAQSSIHQAQHANTAEQVWEVF